MNTLKQNTVYLSLGSNVGDRVNNIHQAMRHIEQSLELVNTSFLYETDPVGYLDQPAFLNCVCVVRTEKTSDELLEHLEEMMRLLGRVRMIHQGPRTIDIDMLLYQNADGDFVTQNTPRLILPHPRMHERAFVLEPLCDIAPDLMHPLLHKNMRTLLGELSAVDHIQPLQKVTEISGKLFKWGTKSYVMGIVNITSDSFSGDGLLGKDATSQISALKKIAGEGVDILDIGGMSTRPGHALISEVEESRRVEQILKVFRELNTPKELNSSLHVPLSVDTFRATVAGAAINQGAGLINSVWGGAYDPQLFLVARDAQVPIVLTENRSVTDYFQTEARMEKLIADAITTGIYRWNIIIDPGIGFVKHAKDNIKIIAHIPKLKALGFPILVGASRKKFLRTIADTDENEKLVALNVLVHLIALALGADIVRVHDVEEVMQGRAVFGK